MRSQIGSVRSVLWEHRAVDHDGVYRMKGLTDNYLPVQKASGTDLANTVTSEQIAGVHEGVLCVGTNKRPYELENNNNASLNMPE